MTIVSLSNQHVTPCLQQPTGIWNAGRHLQHPSKRGGAPFEPLEPPRRCFHAIHAAHHLAGHRAPCGNAPAIGAWIRGIFEGKKLIDLVLPTSERIRARTEVLSRHPGRAAKRPNHDSGDQDLKIFLEVSCVLYPLRWRPSRQDASSEQLTKISQLCRSDSRRTQKVYQLCL